MRENEVQDTQAQKAAPVTETKAAKFERERYTRRQALRKLGMTTVMATFAMFSVDDLARMVGTALQQRTGDSRVAEQVAQELRQAGIALADSPSDGSSNSTADPCGQWACKSPSRCNPYKHT